MERIWDDVARGRPVAVLGRWPGFPAELGLSEVRVRCDGDWFALGAIEEAQRRAEALLGERGQGMRALHRLHQGPTRQWLDPGLGRDPAAALVEIYNRLAAASPRPIGLVFDGVDRADPATLHALDAIVRRPGWLRVPMVLVYHHANPAGPARELLDSLRASLHDDVGVTVDGEVRPEVVRAVPPEALRVLRAAAVAGPGFDASLIAELLGVDALRVIEQLQIASDHGIAVDDLGDGRFHLGEALHRVLTDGLLPSLAAAWHRRLGELLTPQGGEEAGDARAARHFAESGETEKAASRYLVASLHAAEAGAPDQALALGREAIGLLDAVPDNPARRRLRVRILAELAHLQALSAGPGSDFTLIEAHKVADAALALVVDGDPVELQARVRRVLASICFELGDPESLRRGVAELGKAIGALEAGGESVQAAALLNDQAAIWVRLGDPVRAAHLLRASRQVFAERTDDPLALVELAETDHLLARLALHVAPRPGQEEEAIRRCLGHARAAAETYGRLGATRELARVWETEGRVRLRAGQLDEAIDELTRAVDVQQEIGDLLGLARSVEALAQALAQRGQLQRALSLVERSIALNVEKGSPLGLAYLRQVLVRLEAGLDDSVRAALGSQLGQVATRLSQAEALLGRIPAPSTL